MNLEGLELEVDSRQRIDRWIEESQYLLGRIIPSILEDRQRQRGRAEAAETACEDFRRETSDLRKELTELQAEVQVLRNERVELGHAASVAIEHLNQAMQPMTEISQRLRRNPLEPRPYVPA
jgi:predicted  nucleic acid-binding Zn-ribbon protein